MTTPLLQVENLQKCFGATEVLKGLSFELQRRETVALIGPGRFSVNQR